MNSDSATSETRITKLQNNLRTNPMLLSKADLIALRASFFAKLFLFWYAGFVVVMSIAPTDPKIWVTQNVLPVVLVGILVLTHRSFPLSTPCYLLITIWLTLHTMAAHYTYPKVPLGFWLDQMFHFQRNHFDRIVHFSFGLLWTYPLVEVFRRSQNLKGWLLPYVAVMTILGFSACWEIFEAWIGQIAHPRIEMAFVGHQGDVWDPQRDIASALYGSLLCLVLLRASRWLNERSGDIADALEPAPVLEPALSSDPVSELSTDR